VINISIDIAILIVSLCLLMIAFAALVVQIIEAVRK